jgi:hypothetical protein
MDNTFKRLSERLAERASRRGFMYKVGAAALGVAAVLAGHGFLPQAAEAAPACCTSGHAGPCAHKSCPSGSTVKYTWRCGVNGTSYYVCHDCKTSRGKLVCVYATFHA